MYFCSAPKYQNSLVLKMTRYANGPVSQLVSPDFSNGMTWSNKLEILLGKFNLKLKIGPNEGDCKSFYISGEQVGIIRSDIWKHLQHYPNVFQYDRGSQSVTLNPDWRTYEERSEKLDAILRELKTKRIFSTLDGWRDECYDVSLKFGDVPAMKMERSATCLFGIKRCGVHVNGYVKNEDGSKSLWVQKRAFTKPTWPGKLDNMVSGGFAVGMTVFECVRKEAQEEASLPENLLNIMVPVGAVSSWPHEFRNTVEWGSFLQEISGYNYRFTYEDERGIFPETLFIFDVEIPSDFIPTNSDNEVESFHLFTVEEFKSLLLTDDFKITSSLVGLDFLVRHGYLNCDDEPNYMKLLETLHTPLHYHHFAY